MQATGLGRTSWPISRTKFVSSSDQRAGLGESRDQRRSLPTFAGTCCPHSKLVCPQCAPPKIHLLPRSVNGTKTSGLAPGRHYRLLVTTLLSPTERPRGVGQPLPVR